MRITKNIFRTLTVGALAIAVTISGGSIASASENINDKYTPITTEMRQSFAEMADIASHSIDITNQQEIAKYTSIAKTLLNSEKVIVKAGKSNLDFNTVHVLRADFKGKTYTYFNIPISGKYSKLSNINLIFNASDKLINFTETLIENNAQTNKFIVTNYQNGSLIEKKQTDIDYISDKQIADGIEGLKNAGYEKTLRGWGAKVACLGSVLGVNGIVAKLIAATCVAACAAEPVGGAVCAACVGGVCVIGGADIAAIVGCFKL